MNHRFDESIVPLLACPSTRSPLALADRNGLPVLVCTDPAIHLCYPIRDGIPELLIDSGIALTPEEHGVLLAKVH